MNQREFRELVYDRLRKTDEEIQEMGFSVDWSSVKIGDEISRE